MLTLVARGGRTPAAEEVTDKVQLGAGFPCGGSPCAFRAWPLAWPSPSGPLGWQRLRRSRAGALDAGGASPDNARRSGLVFPSQVGTPADASHVGRSFRRVVEAAGWILTTGLRPSCGTASSRCSSMPTYRSSTSPAWSATAARRRPRRSTASRSAR